jgi:hypothetical protein
MMMSPRQDQATILVRALWPLREDVVARRMLEDAIRHLRSLKRWDL